MSKVQIGAIGVRKLYADKPVIRNMIVTDEMLNNWGDEFQNAV